MAEETLITEDELRAHKTWFAITYPIATIIEFVIGGMVLLLLPNNTGDTIGAQGLVLLAILLFMSVTHMVLIYIYCQRTAYPRSVLLVILGAFPLVHWMIFLHAASYIPEHIETSITSLEELAPRYGWIIIATAIVIPCGLGSILALINSTYMGQLFFGPERGGAYIPGIPIPCGWPILTIIGMFVLLQVLSVWLGFNRRVVRGNWLVALGVMVVIPFSLAAVSLILLGPAMVQLFREFFFG